MTRYSWRLLKKLNTANNKNIMCTSHQIILVNGIYCQAQPPLNSIQFNANCGWDGLYFISTLSSHLPTHPPIQFNLSICFSFKYFFRAYKAFETLGTILIGCHQLQWHLSRQNLTRQHSAISQLVLNQFGPNIISSFRGQGWILPSSA